VAAVVVALYRPLRRFAGGLEELRVEADSPLAAVHAATAACPGLARHLLDDHGGLRRSVRLFLNGRDACGADMPAVRLADHDRLEIVLALAGG
jgi:hypothetical protein